MENNTELRETLSNNYYNTLPDIGLIKIRPSIVDPFVETHESYISYMKNSIVRAPLPENITVGLGNSVSQSWSYMKFKDKIGNISSFTGINLNKGIAERQFWEEIEPKDVSVELSFVAHNSAKYDVYLPSQTLLLFAAASDVSNSWYDLSWRRPANVDVIMGNMVTYYKCLLKSVDVTYSNKVDPNGYPLSSTVSITFITSDPMGWRHIHANTVGGGKPEDVFKKSISDMKDSAINSIGKFQGVVQGSIQGGIDYVIGRDGIKPVELSDSIKANIEAINRVYK